MTTNCSAPWSERTRSSNSVQIAYWPLQERLYLIYYQVSIPSEYQTRTRHPRVMICALSTAANTRSAISQRSNSAMSVKRKRNALRCEACFQETYLTKPLNQIDPPFGAWMDDSCSSVPGLIWRSLTSGQMGQELGNGRVASSTNACRDVPRALRKHFSATESVGILCAYLKTRSLASKPSIKCKLIMKVPASL